MSNCASRLLGPLQEQNGISSFHIFRGAFYLIDKVFWVNLHFSVRLTDMMTKDEFGSCCDLDFL